MKRIYFSIVPLALIFTSCLFQSVAFTQILPKAQKSSVFANSKINIDGNAKELNNKFEAYNTSNLIFYTICNDENNIYLIVQATDRLASRKIIAGGLTFSLSPILKISDAKSVSVTYPIFEYGKNSSINIKSLPSLTKDSSRNSYIMDSISHSINTMHNEAKQIAITGIKTVDDTISVYNQFGIKAAAKFNDKLVYTYELQLPLKFLDQLKDNNSTFKYNIKLNGSDKYEGVVIETILGGTRTTWVGDKKDRPSDFELNFMANSTNVSGTYQLAKEE